ncbi:hypothetical protein H310_07934 [Aphanomyces invadans]|uniref:Uncharacterized protein n=1 Tax=Aphanomyces invadans TaxID=157072 RepID=A0A024U109_9STRA|nr:hypothetical protein H310_07934 [Aphanomyces invadans]ETV99903.1 hypothetical protein H310_07934 [Aphanomyces invadans]|eukprot:XP_008871679.1 hypothetical protein H310_07934 [Aphanomyces invadans]
MMRVSWCRKSKLTTRCRCRRVLRGMGTCSKSIDSSLGIPHISMPLDRFSDPCYLMSTQVLKSFPHSNGGKTHERLSGDAVSPYISLRDHDFVFMTATCPFRNDAGRILQPQVPATPCARRKKCKETS